MLLHIALIAFPIGSSDSLLTYQQRIPVCLFLECLQNHPLTVGFLFDAVEVAENPKTSLYPVPSFGSNCTQVVTSKHPVALWIPPELNTHHYLRCLR